MTNDLQEHMNALERSAAYQVERVIKQAPQEVTEEVFFEGHNGAKLGPFVRKRIARESDLGRAYEVLYEAQQAGRRFLYLPRIRDCFKTEDELIVIMDWIAGETLAEVLEHEGSSLEFAAPLFVQICDAVSELHTSFDPSLIHRDITPSNVVVSAGVPTLIDLGIARSYNEEAALDTHQLGTFGYAAPEQYGFGQSDVRTDVYGLGMVLYFCCTGITPDTKARANRFRAEGIPEEVSCVIEKATALTPGDRYESAAALKRAFVTALEEYRERLVDEKAKKSVNAITSNGQGDAVDQETLCLDVGTGAVGKGVINNPDHPAGCKRNQTSASTSHKSSISTQASASCSVSSPLPSSESGAQAAIYPPSISTGSPAFSSPFPFIPALVWDILLILFWLLCLISMVVAGTFEDPVTGVKVPATQKPIDLMGACLIFTIPATILFSSRPLQEFNPKWCLSWKSRLIILGIELCLFILFIILASIF